MLDQGLDAAERFSAGEDLHRLEEFARRFESSANLEGHHPAESTHLPLRELMLWMRGQPGIAHLLQLRMAREHLGDALSILRVPLHSHVKRFNAAQHEEA